LLLNCNIHAYIPTDEVYGTLNLVSAVQVMSYELRMAANILDDFQTQDDDLQAEYNEVQQFYTQLEKMLLKIDYLKENNRGKLIPRLKRLFNRARLEKMEINILRGIISSINDKID